MKEKRMFIADDESVHHTERDARRADARYALAKLVDDEVSYCDNRETVMDFLTEHGASVLGLLRVLHDD